MKEEKGKKRIGKRIPELFEIRNGKHLGKKSGERYIWWECPRCGRLGWANTFKLIYDPPLGLCDKCYPFINNEYRGIICDKIKSINFVDLKRPKRTIGYEGQEFYFFEGSNVEVKKVKKVSKFDKKYKSVISSYQRENKELKSEISSQKDYITTLEELIKDWSEES